MPAKDPSDRITISSIGGLTRWAMEPDRVTATEPMRTARQKKYEEQVDPDGVLPLAERQQRAENLMRADMKRLALRSAQARRARARRLPAVSDGDAA